ncbi:hypothetical protein FHS95_000139 [Sphingomonas naasensis]|uniref:Bbp19-like phage domain-containing protein n=1 Tax=Sphingomonas naasensis TaxID=1344951 RepID=A0A4S1WU66_9SPHN|nr:hypothetical protein [Sphingomonas naasensis]NIJ18470.1 hypothetical protein [Sphingomonas naasensis]TGX45730.1 hypothetical protein E5A74_00675 [Sphingomonas naasensis]
MSRASQHELDMRVLMASAPFRRFLLRLANAAGIWIPTAGAEQTLLSREGRRSLGLDILREAAAGLPRGATIEHVLVAILSEATPKETPDADPQDESVER